MNTDWRGGGHHAKRSAGFPGPTSDTWKDGKRKAPDDPHLLLGKAIGAAPRAAVVPPDDEWRFDRVPDEEVPFCFLHEFGRRAKKFRERVEAWRKRNPQMVRAAKKLLERTGPFALTVGPSPQERRTALLFGEQGQTPAKSELKKADENGKAWAGWIGLTMGLAEGLPQASDKTVTDLLWPDGLRGDDSRLFLYYFPPFPTVPWLKIQPERARRIAFPLMMPQPANAQNLALLILTAGRDLSAEIEWQRQVQARSGSHFDTPRLESSVRAGLGAYIFAPALREDEYFGVLPPGFHFPTARRVSAAGFAHEQARFIINWAESDKSITRAFSSWLKAKGRRPHPELKIQNLTTAREHLNKLSALRLLARLSHKDAVGVAAQASLYSDERSLRRAKDEAEAILDEIFPD